MKDVYDRDDVELLPLDVLDGEAEAGLLTDEFDWDGERGVYFLDRFRDREFPGAC
jgi:hypothetical protein